jgi:hypothetical protein
MWLIVLQQVHVVVKGCCLTLGACSNVIDSRRPWPNDRTSDAGKMQIAHAPRHAKVGTMWSPCTVFCKKGL